MCFAESHQLHKCSVINKFNDVIDEFHQQMTNDIMEVTVAIKKCHDALKELEKKKEDSSNGVTVLEKEVCDSKKMIELDKQTLISDLASRKANEIKLIQRVIDNIEQRVSSAGSLVKYTEELRDNGVAIDVAHQLRTLNHKADELVKIDDILREADDLDSSQMLFEAVKWLDAANERFTELVKGNVVII